MVTKMFTVFDSKSKAFGVPFFMPTVGMALRAFKDLASDPQTLLYRHPDDFSLYQIGEYDDANATVTNKTPLQMLAVASEFKLMETKELLKVTTEAKS